MERGSIRLASPREARGGTRGEGTKSTRTDEGEVVSRGRRRGVTIWGPIYAPERSRLGPKMPRAS